jgi:AraC family transcriptional regulator
VAQREADRERLERAAELYLQSCYRARSAARVDEFADYLRRSRTHVSRIVPDVIGMPVRDYLRAKQLQHAQWLLRMTPASVEHIALSSAFGTSWTFYRCFKAAFGMTPTEFRRHVTKGEKG